MINAGIGLLYLINVACTMHKSLKGLLLLGWIVLVYIILYSVHSTMQYNNYACKKYQQHLTQGFFVAATFSASSKVSGKCFVFVSGHNHKLTMPAINTMAP